MFCLIFSVGANAENDNVTTQTSPSFSQMNDWRVGNYRRKVKENYLTCDIDVIPVIAAGFSETNPWGAGVRFGYEHKTRPSSISSRFSIGYGGHIGISRYFGKDIEVSAVGNPNAITRDSYKSFTEIPIMLDFSWYYNFSRSSIALHLSAGINMLLGQRDATVTDFNEEYFDQTAIDLLNNNGYVASVQNEPNDVAISHIIPTFRAGLGYMYELSQDWRFRVQAGVEYQMGYEDDYSGYFLNTNYMPYYHKGTSPASLNPFVSVGFVYSL